MTHRARPKAPASARSWREWPVIRGRQIAASSTAASATRRKAVAAGPSSSKSVFAIAAPVWVDAIPTTTNAGAGTLRRVFSSTHAVDRPEARAPDEVERGPVDGDHARPIAVDRRAGGSVARALELLRDVAVRGGVLALDRPAESRLLVALGQAAAEHELVVLARRLERGGERELDVRLVLLARRARRRGRRRCRGRVYRRCWFLVS